MLGIEVFCETVGATYTERTNFCTKTLSHEFLCRDIESKALKRSFCNWCVAFMVIVECLSCSVTLISFLMSLKPPFSTLC